VAARIFPTDAQAAQTASPGACGERAVEQHRLHDDRRRAGQHEAFGASQCISDRLSPRFTTKSTNATLTGVFVSFTE